MWYMDADEEEDGGKGIEEEEEDEDEDEDEFYEEETESEMEGGEGANGTMGGRNGDPHGDGLPHAYLENFMRAVDHGLSLLVHWSTKNWYANQLMLYIYCTSTNNSIFISLHLHILIN